MVVGLGLQPVPSEEYNGVSHCDLLVHPELAGDLLVHRATVFKFAGKAQGVSMAMQASAGLQSSLARSSLGDRNVSELHVNSSKSGCVSHVVH